jgi:hypothetical protein
MVGPPREYQEEATMAQKDRGGSKEKKKPQHDLKEKRQAKKAKKASK